MKAYVLHLTASIILIGYLAEATSIAWGTASTFAVLGGSTVTSTGATVVDGNLGLSPGTSVTGFNPPGIVTGEIHAGNAIASQALTDASAVYATLLLLAVNTDMTGKDLGSQTLAPGVYNFDTSAQLTGNLVLDGEGQYVFLIGSTLTTAANSSIQTINGANWMNVFFQVGTSATLDAGTQFLGNIIADASVTLITGADVDGRVIGINGAVTLDNNHIVVPEPSSTALLAAGLVMLFVRNRRSLAP